jgi:HK97 family phage major capsid protein
MVLEDPNMGFRNLADLAMAVKAFYDPNEDGDDPRLRVLGAPSNYHETSGSDGYNIPPAMRQQIWELALGEESLFGMMVPEPTSGNAVDFLRDETTPWGATGVQANWASEGSQMTPSRLETEGSTLKLNKLYAYVLATEELLSDAPRLNARLTSQSARAIDWKSGEAVFRGNGVGQPLGIQNAACLVSVAKETSQTADTIVAANVAKVYARCINPARAFYLVNQDALPQLMTMTLGDQPIWTPPASGFINAPGGLLFGRPVRFSDHCETLGDAGDLMMINPDGYYAVNKAGGVSFATSIHLYFDYDVQAFRWTFRLGGQPFLSAAVSPNKGSATRSHFVRIAARA